MHKTLMPLAAIAALSALLIWLLWGWEPNGGTAPPHQRLELAQAPKGGDFTLQAASGPVRLADLGGSVVLLYFGYTWCPDVCPTNLGYIAQALEQMTAAERERVRVLFVSVDPQRDSLERLADYTAFFAPEVVGITGSAEQVAAVAELYGAAYRQVAMPDSAAGYLVDHSAYTYLIDPQGRLHGQLDHATPPSQILAAVRELLPAG